MSLWHAPCSSFYGKAIRKETQCIFNCSYRTRPRRETDFSLYCGTPMKNEVDDLFGTIGNSAGRAGRDLSPGEGGG